MDKSTKYDRQLRLWAQDGQTRLEKSHVCLVNATSTGSEILKNLVLPGIGSYTIVDSRNVEEDDLSGNFFLQQLDLGKNIAQTMCACLGELNTDVRGQSVQEDIEILLQKPEFWANFNVVVVSEQLPSLALQALKQLLWEKGIPLLVVSTCGFYATLHIINKETTVVETHDPSRLYDLRVDCPWPELEKYADSFVLEDLDDTEHAHVPYLVIFIKALREWKRRHGGTAPLNYADKKQFRTDYVEGMSRDIRVEINFMEASHSIHRALQVTAVPDSIQKLFHNSIIYDSSLSLRTPPFWLYVRALKEFVDSNGVLPLPGNLPDMASKTSTYVKLQNIFRAKCLEDQQLFKLILLDIFRRIGRSETELNDESISTFCKNAAFLYMSHGSPYPYTEELKKELLGTEDYSSNAATLAIYFGILALHEWKEIRQTDTFDSYLEFFKSLLFNDKVDFSEKVVNVLKELFLHQTTNYHNINSFIGGIAAQEVLKITTEQYIPLDNLYVYDGVRSVSCKWKV